MAGDWIKMRSALLHDPKVLAIARFLGNDPSFIQWFAGGSVDELLVSDGALRYAVTGALHAVWCAVNEHAQSCEVQHAKLTWIDDVCGIANFGKAMQFVGWVEESRVGILFPKFDSNNTSAAERQKRYRQTKRNNVAQRVTSPVAQRVAPREEKRREELDTTNVVSKVTRGKFKPPSIQEVAAYCKERSNGVDPQKWMDHYTAKGWLVGKTPMRDWQAAVRTWEKPAAPTASRVATKEDAANWNPSGPGDEVQR